jgi:molybdate transport system substrate-binding protein
MQFRSVIVRGFALLLALTSCGSDPEESIRVGAAASLRDVLGEAKSAYEALHPGTSLSIEFAASSAIARQIEAGARVDVFVSADRETMDRVAPMMDSRTIGPVLGNVLCMVVRPGLEAPPTDPRALAAFPGRIAVAGAAVPAGKHARALLRDLGILDTVAPKLVDADDVRAALALVEHGAADVGLVYATDGKSAKEATVAWTAADGEGPRVVYVVGAHRDASAAAIEFTQWLRESAEFRAIATKAGFLAVPTGGE